MNFNESFLRGLEFPEDVDNVELDWEFFYSRELPFDWNCTNVLNDDIFFCLLVEKQALKEQGLAFLDLHNGLFSLALDGNDHRSGVVFDCDDQLVHLLAHLLGQCPHLHQLRCFVSCATDAKLLRLNEEHLPFILRELLRAVLHLQRIAHQGHFDFAIKPPLVRNSESVTVDVVDHRFVSPRRILPNQQRPKLK